MPAERPKLVKPVDNLITEGTFERPEKVSFKPAERPKAVKPTDQVKEICLNKIIIKLTITQNHPKLSKFELLIDFFYEFFV